MHGMNFWSASSAAMTLASVSSQSLYAASASALFIGGRSSCQRFWAGKLNAAPVTPMSSTVSREPAMTPAMSSMAPKPGLPSGRLRSVEGMASLFMKMGAVFGKQRVSECVSFMKTRVAMTRCTSSQDSRSPGLTLAPSGLSRRAQKSLTLPVMSLAARAPRAMSTRALARSSEAPQTLAMDARGSASPAMVAEGSMLRSSIILG
mmetsp:Transcript_16156/g.48189  ORF Transcript_16156/g.48189 Transcript_16156/m.48189 type:complete len:205 (-) Transcript_16156:667-1281(-)